MGVRSNFGDELNQLLYHWLTDRLPRRASEGDRGKVLAIGSVLANAKPGDVVWGSGLNGKVKDEDGNILLPARPEAITFRSVRGPLTRKLLVDAGATIPEVYGDPALLVRLFMDPPAERRGTLVIPHYTDMAAAMEQWKHREDTLIWNVDAPVEATLAAINSAARVVTSALHGIIVAEALGVPVIPMRIGNEEALFKFNDYWHGTGRPPTPFVEGLEAALAAEAAEPPVFPEALFEGMMESCPFPLKDALPPLNRAWASGE